MCSIIRHKGRTTFTIDEYLLINHWKVEMRKKACTFLNIKYIQTLNHKGDVFLIFAHKGQKDKNMHVLLLL